MVIEDQYNMSGKAMASLFPVLVRTAECLWSVGQG